MDPFFAGGIGFLVSVLVIALIARIRRPHVVQTPAWALEFESRVKILEEQREFDQDRLERQRGQILTLSRRLTRAERRIDEPPPEELDDDELEDEDLDEDTEFPEGEYERELERKRQQRRASSG